MVPVGMSLSKAIVLGLTGVGLVAGLSIGVSLESKNLSVTNGRLKALDDEIDNTRRITSSINVNPPNGFINSNGLFNVGNR